MKDDRELFELTANVTGFRDQKGALVPIQFKASEDIFAAIHEEQKREFEGKVVPIVRFTRGLDWYWMPASRFALVTKPTVRDRTSTPFQR
jgi:hypothetical protein